MHLTSDKKLAELEINGAYDAAQLEILIQELSDVRAAMEPPIPKAPPPRPEGEDAAAIRAQGDPVVQVAVLRDGKTRFWVRHQGLGWFGFNLPVERASMLATVILDLTSDREAPEALAALRRRQSDLYH
jgi:hypothetical protein